MSDDILRVHSESAQTYDEICLQVESHAHEVVFGLAFEYIDSGEALLDVGVGTGVSSKLFHKAGLAIYGVDNSEEMLAVCRKKGFAKELKKHDLCAGNWPFRTQSFHHAVCCGVLHFVRDLDVFFKETHRVLKDKGTFSFTLIEGMGKNSYVDSGIRIYCHDEEKMLLLASDCGFSLLKRLPFSAFKDPDKQETVHFKAYTLRKL
jgi:ubiquinone/menaquinone biosynthesis C-methylase UbiE